MTSKTVNPHPQRAADLFAGGQSEMARRLSDLYAAEHPGVPDTSLTPQAVGGWCRSGRVPAERVLDVERITNGQVTRHQLRPDLYPLQNPSFLLAS